MICAWNMFITCRIHLNLQDVEHLSSILNVPRLCRFAHLCLDPKSQNFFWYFFPAPSCPAWLLPWVFVMSVGLPSLPTQLYDHTLRLTKNWEFLKVVKWEKCIIWAYPDYFFLCREFIVSGLFKVTVGSLIESLYWVLENIFYEF